MTDYKRWAIIGGIVGAALPFVSSFISKNLIPSLTVTFSALEATTIKPGFPEAASNIFLRFVTTPTLPDYLIAAIGGAIFVVLGAFLYGLKPTARTTFGKLFLVLLYASLAFSALALFANGLAAAFPVLIIASINSFIVAWFIIALSKLNIIKIP